jgi:hypothetical protein
VRSGGVRRVAGAARIRSKARQVRTPEPAPVVFAVVPPSAAAWMLGRLRLAGVTSVAVRNEVAWLRGTGAVARAAQLELAWNQLQRAARSQESPCGEAS